MIHDDSKPANGSSAHKMTSELELCLVQGNTRPDLVSQSDRLGQREFPEAPSWKGELETSSFAPMGCMAEDSAHLLGGYIYNLQFPASVTMLQGGCAPCWPVLARSCW